MIRKKRESLKKAILPFAYIGNVFLKHGERDDSCWTEVPDDLEISLRWNHLKITVKDLRRIATLAEELKLYD